MEHNLNRFEIHINFMLLQFQLDTNEYISIFLASVVWTILFDAPFQNIKKILLKRPVPVKQANGTNSLANTKSENLNNNNNSNTNCDRSPSELGINEQLESKGETTANHLHTD